MASRIGNTLEPPYNSQWPDKQILAIAVQKVRKAGNINISHCKNAELTCNCDCLNISGKQNRTTITKFMELYCISMNLSAVSRGRGRSL